MNPYYIKFNPENQFLTFKIENGKIIPISEDDEFNNLIQEAEKIKDSPDAFL